MTIDLRDIANILIIISTVYTIITMTKMMYKSRKDDKKMNILMDEIQRDHMEFIKTLKMKSTKPKLSVVENKDKE